MTMPIQIVGFILVCYLLLYNHDYLHCHNHVETKYYITSCKKPEQNYLFIDEIETCCVETLNKSEPVRLCG